MNRPRCSECDEDFLATRSGHELCSPRCRQRKVRRVRDARQVAIADLVMRQTRAIIAGASEAELDALLADAIVLVGDDR